MLIEKPSKKAIKELFEDKYFPYVLERIRKGHVDPYDVYSWHTNPDWGLDTYHFHMTKEGAEKVNKFKESGSTVLNITAKDDNEFMLILINKHYGGLLIWMLEIMGFENYEDINSFDPYKYKGFTDYVTRYES